MPNCLILTLQGVFQAWGKHSFETYRPTELFPTRSGITGFLAAALGITRDEHDKIIKLNNSYKYAVRCDNKRAASLVFDKPRLFQSGRKITDFHTVQEVRTVGNNSKPTEITRREYLEDQNFTVALMETQTPTYDLHKFVRALRAPYFSLYLGRKSCPLCTPPLRCELIAENLYDALLSQKPSSGIVYSEETVEARHFIQTVRDIPIGKRTFDVRKVFCYEMED
ncbi:MAG: type I-E CRISPR-associated protein Cas5/CasD [Clostridia bacterium]|nr:type I-E CRISPR-associated protein Cas5/CasD [Clostridia bacterium]